jgi:hypothetical protein
MNTLRLTLNTLEARKITGKRRFKKGVLEKILKRLKQEFETNQSWRDSGVEEKHQKFAHSRPGTFCSFLISQKS